MKYLGWFLLLAWIGVLAGCGSSTSTPPEQAATGRIAISIAWPQPTRLIPVMTNSIKIQLSNDDGPIHEEVVDRPAGGFSTVTIPDLPVGNIMIYMTAYPDFGGGGNPLASGGDDKDILEGQTVQISVVMNSTIDHLVVSALISSIVVGGTGQLTATAVDADGHVVLIPADGILWTSENPQIASVDSTGLVTGNLGGRAAIIAVEKESGKSATMMVQVEYVVNSQITNIIVTPTNAHVYEGRTLQLTATARNANNQILPVGDRVIWELEAPPGYYNEGGATISPLGLLSAERVGDVWVKVRVIPEGGDYPAPAGYTEVHILATQHYQEVWRKGALGGADSQFYEPNGIAVDRFGNVYVADKLNHRVQKFDTDGNFITKWGSYGSGDGQFHRPCGIAVDDNDNVYVTDLNNYRVQKFTADGEFLRKWGAKGHDISRFTDPHAIDVDQNGRVFVLDSENMEVQVFDTDGNFLNRWGIVGRLDGMLWHPSGLAAYPDGTLLIADHQYRIQRFTATGAYLAFSYENQTNNRWWYWEPGSLPGQLMSPGGIAIDADRNFYVADLNNMRIQKYDDDATFVTGWGTPTDGLFNVPADVAVDASGQVFVVDMLHHQIVKFVKIP